jgi:hypothetical protein
MPANVSFFLNMLLPLVMFDILDVFEGSKYDPTRIFMFDDDMNVLDKKLFTDQMADLGYQTHNSILNLKTIFFLMALYFLRVFLILILFIRFELTGKKPGLYDGEMKRLFFSEILTLSLEGYMELVISGYLQSKKDYLYNSIYGETISVICGYFCLTQAFVVLPICFFLLVKTKKQDL